MNDLDSAPARRMGPEGSATWNLLLDGAESLLREEGYAALTSRRIAARAGVKQQLVYYYFRTMDDLMVECFRRLSKRELERLTQALDAGRPLQALWSVSIHTNDARLVLEFMALANRSEGVRGEVIAFIEESRRIQAVALGRCMAARPDVAAQGLSPLGVAFLATSVALAFNREAALGVTTGHAEVEALIERTLAGLEPGEGGR
jgi:AcrR family transcriptional regulator